MLWCKDTFEQRFDHRECRLFALQQQLFAFVDGEAATTTEGGDAWLCFSIEFPSAGDVSRLLSRHSATGRAVALFQPTRDATGRGSAQKRPREDFSLIYGDAPLSQQTRMFLAATLAGVRSILAAVEARQLHLYEIIRDGSPCHLYFDVEREENYVAVRSAIAVDDSTSSSTSISSSSSVAVVDDDTFVCVDDAEATRRGGAAFRCTTARYQELTRRAAAPPPNVCGLDCTVEPDNARTCEVLLRELEAFVRERFPSLLRPLDAAGGHEEAAIFEEVWVLQSVPLSGAATKFSQHFVVKLRNTLFDSTRSVKAFVRQFVTFLSERAVGQRSIHSSLFFHGPPVWCSVFDTLSADYPRNTLPFLPRRCVVDEAVYSKNRMMRCLGSCKLSKTSVLRVHEHYVQGRKVNTSAVAEAAPPSLGDFVSALIVPRPSVAATCRRFQVEEDVAGSSGASKTTLRPSAAGTCASTWEEGDVPGDASVAPIAAALQRTYAKLAHTDCVVSRPRKLLDRFVTFQVQGTRYCQRIKREHKSNNVYLVVDLERRTFVQKCFDPDCAYYRSPPLPLNVEKGVAET